MPFRSSVQKAEARFRLQEKDRIEKRDRKDTPKIKRKGRYDAFRNKWRNEDNE